MPERRMSALAVLLLSITIETPFRIVDRSAWHANQKSSPARMAAPDSMASLAMCPPRIQKMPRPSASPPHAAYELSICLATAVHSSLDASAILSRSPEVLSSTCQSSRETLAQS
eukprot:scaffold2438_cov69-Phaeocystis_antarctica.AAC.3